MSKFTLEIETDNAAFEDDVYAELSSLLRAVAIQVRNEKDSGNIKDSNGNRVGSFELQN